MENLINPEKPLHSALPLALIYSLWMTGQKKDITYTFSIRSPCFVLSLSSAKQGLFHKF
jgi:hypothetical protein